MHTTAPRDDATVASPPAASELRAAPGPVIASTAGTAFSIATLGFTYSIGAFVGPLVAEFGWTRQDILGVQPLITLAVVTLSAATGWFADRHGVRRLILVSQLLFALGFFALAAWLDSLTSFYILYFLLAVAGGGTLGIGFARILAQRFDRQRGLALGLAMSGTGLCGFLVPPYATWAIEQFGWRGGYVALGLLPLCIALPLAWRYLHDDPAPSTTPPSALRSAARVAVAGACDETDVRERPPAPRLEGTSFATALRGRRFWFMAIGLFTCSGMMTALITSAVPLLQEHGTSAAVAARIASVFGIAVIVGRVAVGFLIDRFWGPLVGAALMFPAALAVAALAALQPGVEASVLIVFVAGLAAGAEVDLMAYLASRYFGLREFGRIYGALYTAFALGPGVMVPLFGRLRDLSGNYQSGLLMAAAGIAVFGLLLLGLGPYPPRHSPVPGTGPVPAAGDRT
jgi:MFS family permease